MVYKRIALRDHNQAIKGRHNHTNRLESWSGLPFQAYSSHVPALGGQAGVLVACNCGKEAWLGFNERRRK